MVLLSGQGHIFVHHESPLVIKLSLLQRHFSVFGHENIFLDALVFDDWCFIGHAFGPPSATGICIETFLDFKVEKRMPDRPQPFG